MTSTSDIMRAANPVADHAFADAWNDAEGRATFERIAADDHRLAHAHRPRRHRRLLLAGAIAAAAGAAVAVVGLPGAPHNGAPAAWAVHQNPDGTITVELSDYRDPAGLQAQLIAAGLDARVVHYKISGTCFTGTDQIIPANSAEPTPTFGGLVVMGSRDPDLTYRYTVDPETRMIVGDDSSTTEVALRIDPAKQRPGDVVWFGFPPAGHELAGRDMRVEFTAPGEAPPECFD